MSRPRLNRKLVLEAPVRVSDASGGYTVDWQALGTLWAQMTARTGQEIAVGSAPVSAVSYRIVVRASPEGAVGRPQPDQRFSEGSRTYRIVAVTEHDVEGQYLICFASEETAV